VIRVLERIDFRLARQKGSHAIYKNAEGKRATVPMHSGRTLHPKVLKSILGDTGLSVDEFKALL
jgi:predicted RNA binding protein YcfA (HicA-like mRNA interferase family)